jgi:aminocarboxymuconate-semialdehyde decarboxylase
MREKEIFWVDDDRHYMHQGKWRRPITDPSFFLHEKMAWMDKHGIDHAVILNLSQLYCNGLHRDLAHDAIRFQNDFNARIQREYPTRFTGGFVVTPACLDDALAETERCVTELGLELLCLPTHYQTYGGEWLSIADESVSPLWELANEYGLAVEVHPYDAPQMVNLADEHWRFHLIWMLAQTADTYHLFTLRDLPRRYPRVRTCFAHGNQFGQVNVGRRIQGFLGRPDLFQGTQHPATALGAGNVYFDTLVHDVPAFRLLLERQGVRQLVAGLDDPYPLGEMENVPGCYPGRVIAEAREQGLITAGEEELLWCDNTLAWLAGDHPETLLTRLHLAGSADPA